jgi:ribonuclease D
MDAESVAAALADMGARPWQIDATAQLISQAFVDAHQIPDDTPESSS